METEFDVGRVDKSLALRLERAVQSATAWMRDRMMANPDGSLGIWERVIIDAERTQHWVRSDCVGETAQLMGCLPGDDAAAVSRNLVKYLLSTQYPSGAFPFFRRIVPEGETSPGSEPGEGVWPNDNGKVLEILAEWADRAPGDGVGTAAERLGDYFVTNQTDAGWWRLNDVDYPGSCFVVWPLTGLCRLWARTGTERYRASALKALNYLRSLQLPNGRFRTSYEINSVENWRPVSSESAMALKALSVAQQTLGEDLLEGIARCGEFVLSLASDRGAVRNCDAGSLDASQQNDPDLTDLVYTDGYALAAFLEAYRATDAQEYRDAAVQLARFLAEIQCWGESPCWDGAWRGSYDLVRGEWRGRANQENPLDEGGMYSAYTGWCAAPIAMGMVRVIAGDEGV